MVEDNWIRAIQELCRTEKGDECLGKLSFPEMDPAETVQVGTIVGFVFESVADE